MSSVNSNSHVLCKYEASLVKCDDPGSIIFDIHYHDRDFITEIEAIKAMNKKITNYWNVHQDDPIDGRRFLLGEIVAVNVVNSWKAGMIVNFKFVDGLHHYELLLLDSGHLIEVHRMAFRQMDDDMKIFPRFSFFVMMNLFPTADDASAQSSWSIDACQNLQLVFDLATSITVDVMARQRFCNSEKLFGNIYVHIGKHVIDVKDMLLKQNTAYEDPKAFKRIYQLKFADLANTYHEEIPDFGSEESEYEKVEVPEITDENLDSHLYTWWRKGGSDPLTTEERLRVRSKLTGESRISFARHQSLVKKSNDSYGDWGNSSSQCERSEDFDSTESYPHEENHHCSQGENFNYIGSRGKFNNFKWEPRSGETDINGVYNQTKGKKIIRFQIPISHECVEERTDLDSTDADRFQDEEQEDMELVRKFEYSFTRKMCGSNASNSSSRIIDTETDDETEINAVCESTRKNTVKPSGNPFFKNTIEIPSEEAKQKLLALFQ